MINNSININKTNDYNSPQIIDHKKKPRHMLMEIQVLSLEVYKCVAAIHIHKR